MVKPVACLTLLAVLAFAADHVPRHGGHDHDEPSATVTGEAADSTDHSHGDGDDHAHESGSSADTSTPAESTDPVTVSAASTMDLTWSAAVGLIVYIGSLV